MNTIVEKIDQCKAMAKTVRLDIIEMIYRAGAGHPGSSLSCVEALVALYYGGYMNVRVEEPKWPDRDRFVLSKGHASPTLYSILAHKGFFPLETLSTFRKTYSILCAYPDIDTPGVDMESGSLGNGLSTSVGMALAARLKKQDYHVYTLLGDGELQEGMVWEAIMCAGHYKLNNLTAIVDRNHLQITGAVEDVMSIEPLTEKWKAFGWKVLTVDGHDFRQLFDAYDEAKAYKDGPTVIIADTVKGKGVSYMENVLIWHRNVISDVQYKRAIEDINGEEGQS